jgi:hypothetical protein
MVGARYSPSASHADSVLRRWTSGASAMPRPRRLRSIMRAFCSPKSRQRNSSMRQRGMVCDIDAVPHSHLFR